MMFFVEFVYYWDIHYCINGGWYTEKINVLFTAATAFYNCYKNFILAYCDYDNWVGQSALFIDDCT